MKKTILSLSHKVKLLFFLLFLSVSLSYADNPSSKEEDLLEDSKERMVFCVGSIEDFIFDGCYDTLNLALKNKDPHEEIISVFEKEVHSLLNYSHVQRILKQESPY